MNKTTFCDSCMCLREGKAKFCIECGRQLLSIVMESLALDKVNCKNICRFLVDVLGYKGASWHEECSIIAKYETDSNSPKGRELLLTPEDVLFIDIEDDHICIFAYLELIKDPSDDIEFFKILNRLNDINGSFLNFSYIGSEEDEAGGCGKLKFSWKVPYIPSLPLVYLYRLCRGGFERSFVQKMGLCEISPLFADYFGILVGSFRAPSNTHRTL